MTVYSGGSRGRTQSPPPSLFLDQTKAGRAENFLGETGPPLFLRVTAPPYLKVWMRHWYTLKSSYNIYYRLQFCAGQGLSM